MATNSASTQFNFFVKSSSIKYVQVRPEMKDKKIGFNVQTVSKGVQSVTNVYSIGTQCITVVQDVIASTVSNSSQRKDNKTASTRTGYTKKCCISCAQLQNVIYYNMRYAYKQ